MVTSMTGYGRASAEGGGVRVQVEINSVNSRYCEVHCSCPRSLNPHVTKFQKKAKSALKRGKVNVSIQVEELNTDSITPGIDEARVQAYAEMLQKVRTAAGITDPLSLDHILKYTDLFSQQDDPDATSEAHWTVALPAFEKALSALMSMRETEGLSLKDDISSRLSAIESEAKLVEDRAPFCVAEARDRLKTRVSSLIADEKVVEERIEMEIVLLAEKSDVTEEIVRLGSHISQFRAALDAEESPGRKLNFLAQELNREINTIGSKANDAEITQRVVRMKEELEKIREQVQNIV